MEMIFAKKGQWKEIRDVYTEAFPKAERKPFFAVKHSVKSGKAEILTAVENGELHGFVMLIPYRDMVMVDYLAVSAKSRGRGTGSGLMQEVCRRYPDMKIVLLIERLDDNAANREQRIARRKFYMKNGFLSSGIFIKCRSGDMEVLNFNRDITKQEYMSLQKYALGNIMFRLSHIKIE